MDRIGFAVVYLAFAYALVAAWFATISLVERGGFSSRRARFGTALGAVGVVIGFSLPSVAGFPEGTLDGWSALDPFSVGAAVLIAILLVTHAVRGDAGGTSKPTIVGGLAASLTGLVGGNCIIQSFTDVGSRPAVGLWISTAAAVLALAAAVSDLRRVRD